MKHLTPPIRAALSEISEGAALTQSAEPGVGSILLQQAFAVVNGVPGAATVGVVKADALTRVAKTTLGTQIALDARDQFVLIAEALGEDVPAFGAPDTAAALTVVD